MDDRSSGSQVDARSKDYLQKKKKKMLSRICLTEEDWRGGSCQGVVEAVHPTHHTHHTPGQC